MTGHSKTVKRFHLPGDCHELTFSCYRRLPLLTDDEPRILLAERLDRVVATHSCRLVAYVFMPEHVHILIQPTTIDFRVDRFLWSLKTPFSSCIRRIFERREDRLLRELTVRERPGVACFRFWQEGGGYDRNLRTIRAVEAATIYIHENPVRRRLCDRAADWRWSSARHYRPDEPVAPAAGLPPMIHGLSPDFYLDRRGT